jgi:hypothetical protein
VQPVALIVDDNPSNLAALAALLTREAGFHSFLGKPLNVGRFPNLLRRILSGQPVWEVE